jgi:hypothetical protein
MVMSACRCDDGGYSHIHIRLWYAYRYSAGFPCVVKIVGGSHSRAFSGIIINKMK